jgi:hypothetical protein
MIGKLRRYVIRKRFERMIKWFDDQIEEARKAHKPTKALILAKREYVHQRLAGEQS